MVFLLGRFYRVKGPGLIIVVPFTQQMVRVRAGIYFRVVDAQEAIINVEDYLQATSQLAQTTLRSVLGQHELDEMLANREMLNTDIQVILDARPEGWGIKVSNVEIKHVDLNEVMIRAIARQAEPKPNEPEEPR
jgi:regulator of protease activity HflC (stomatin/prohibitin superfamily)